MSALITFIKQTLLKTSAYAFGKKPMQNIIFAVITSAFVLNIETVKRALFRIQYGTYAISTFSIISDAVATLITVFIMTGMASVVFMVVASTATAIIKVFFLIATIGQKNAELKIKNDVPLEKRWYPFGPYTLTIIVPCFREKNKIGQTILNLFDLKRWSVIRFRVQIMDDSIKPIALKDPNNHDFVVDGPNVTIQMVNGTNRTMTALEYAQFYSIHLEVVLRYLSRLEKGETLDKLEKESYRNSRFYYDTLNPPMTNTCKKILDTLGMDESHRRDDLIIKQQRYHSQDVKAVYQLREYMVIRKINGGKKDDALNCGLNYVDTPFVGVQDADTLYGANAIDKCMEKFLDPLVDLVFGVVLPENKKSFIVMMQRLNYIGSFYGNRLGMSALGINAVVSGAMNIARMKFYEEVGGYRDIVGEDGGLTMDFLIRNKLLILNGRKPRKMVFVTEAADTITSPAENFTDAVRQQNRWGRANVQCLDYAKKYLCGSNSHKAVYPPTMNTELIIARYNDKASFMDKFRLYGYRFIYNYYYDVENMLQVLLPINIPYMAHMLINGSAFEVRVFWLYFWAYIAIYCGYTLIGIINRVLCTGKVKDLLLIPLIPLQGLLYLACVKQKVVAVIDGKNMTWGIHTKR